MIELSKPVLRKVSVSSRWFRKGTTIFTLHPKGWLGVREAGCRAQYKVDFVTVISLAVRNTVNKLDARTRELRSQGYKLSEARKLARVEVLANVEK